ncbi:MAG: hypothetical protein NVS1B13_20590 [Flavisolibacter sp.]
MEKNLEQGEALKKFKKLIKEINICMFITDNNQNNHTRPMATIEVDENGTLWFFSDIRSIKVEEVEQKQTVHLVYAHPGKESYIDLWGKASMNRDKKLIRDKWSAIVKAWFPGGVEDPNLCLLKVEPYDVYYWDAETGKMVAFLKMAAAAITGARLADSTEGKLKVN